MAKLRQVGTECEKMGHGWARRYRLGQGGVR